MKCFSVAKNGKIARPKVVEELHKSIAENLDGTPQIDTEELGSGIGSLFSGSKSPKVKDMMAALRGDESEAKLVTSWEKLCTKS